MIASAHRATSQLRRFWRCSAYLFIAVITLALTISPAWGQIPSPSATASPAAPASPKLELPNPLAAVGAANASDISTQVEPVRLDGRKLFSIAAPAVRNQSEKAPQTPPIRERVNWIEATLNQIADSKFNPKQLSVTATIDAQSGLPIISVNDSYLMTVTTLDAQLQGQNPTQHADELVPIIREALLTARQERQPAVLTRQGVLAAEIFFGMLLASSLVFITQQRLHRQRQRIDSQAAIDITPSPDALNPTDATAISTVQAQMDRRRRRNVNDAQRRLLQLIQAGIWGGGSFVILGLFPYTRWVQPLVLSGPLKVLGIVLLTYILIRISDVIIDRFFGGLVSNTLVTPDTSQRLALRVSTFSRVLRSVVGVLLIGTGVLSVLSVVGVELGPLLAGAGILGLAISFASQNLIKDIINGLLILAEDQYAVGDVIQIGKVSGLVESMNLRITQLRNAEGRLITIPNSTITVVENLSKDWSRVDLAITIAYDADVDKAIDVIQTVGEKMCNDLDWRSKIPEPPEVLGIDEIGNEGITIRIWIKTLPLQQWSVAREYRRRLKRALDKQGIAIGVPQQSFWFRNTANDAPRDPDGEVQKLLNNNEGK